MSAATQGSVRPFIVEVTIHSRVVPVRVYATDREGAKDAAAAARPECERIWGAYTIREWRKAEATRRGAP